MKSLDENRGGGGTFAFLIQPFRELAVVYDGQTLLY